MAARRSAYAIMISVDWYWVRSKARVRAVGLDNVAKYSSLAILNQSQRCNAIFGRIASVQKMEITKIRVVTFERSRRLRRSKNQPKYSGPRSKVGSSMRCAQKRHAACVTQ